MMYFVLVGVFWGFDDVIIESIEYNFDKSRCIKSVVDIIIVVVVVVII